jgi:TDG/mug DNA glycosylase family protein
MDRATVDIYEDQADRWLARRTPNQLATAEAFAARVGSGPVADLGCGPGWYSAPMPAPVIAMDAARSMLDLVAERAPTALRVQGDLEALPLRPASLRGAWASASYVHLSRGAMPMALRDLHGSLVVGGSAELRLFVGDAEGDFGDDDFPGRFFSLWQEQHLRDVLSGAGFAIDALELHERPHDPVWQVRLTKDHRLADTVRPGMRLLVCGLNPSIYSADVGEHYARPGNRFWPAALSAGLVSRDRDSLHALLHHGVGMTNVVARPSVAAAELTLEEYRTGMARLERLCAWLQPGAVCFVGLAGWRAAVDRRAEVGVQPRTLGGVPVYVMGSTSGLNARTLPAAHAAHLRAAGVLADRNA